MRRILCALITVFSLFANFRLSQAQTKTATDRPAKSAQETERGRGGPVGPTHAPHIATSAEAERNLPNGTVIVERGTVTSDIAVHDTPLLLEGEVHGDVLAVHSQVTIAPTARVTGNVVVIDGVVDNQAGSAVHVVAQGRGVLTGLSGFIAIQTPNIGAAPAIANHAPKDWLGGQLALLLFGLVCGFLAFVAAPRATNMIADEIVRQPGASLLTGVVSVGILLLANGAGALLLHSPARILWAPFGAAVALASLVLLTCGWVCGMRYAGEWVAKKMGRAPQGDSLYLRIAIGMGAFFFLNSFLGQIRPQIAVFGLAAEFAVAVMGMGSLLLTRFGTRTDRVRLP